MNKTHTIDTINQLISSFENLTSNMDDVDKLLLQARNAMSSLDEQDGSTSETTSAWLYQMEKVFGDKSIYALSFALLSVLRTSLSLSEVPILYLYGPTATGKTTFMQSLNHLFKTTFANPDSSFHKPLAFGQFSNLEYDDFFSKRTGGILCLDEFPADLQDSYLYSVIKNSSDVGGQSHLTKNNISINSTIVLAGQHLQGVDDQSLLTRSIIQQFKWDASSDKKTHLNGLGNLLNTGNVYFVNEVFQYIDHFKSKFSDVFQESLHELEWSLQKDNTPGRARIVESYAAIYSLLKIALELNMFIWPERFNKQNIFSLISYDLHIQINLIEAMRASKD